MITNLWMQLFEALKETHEKPESGCGKAEEILPQTVKFLPTNVEANQVTRVGFDGNLFLEYFHLSRIIQKCLFPLYNNFDTFDLANNFAGPKSTILQENLLRNSFLIS